MLYTSMLAKESDIDFTLLTMCHADEIEKVKNSYSETNAHIRIIEQWDTGFKKFVRKTWNIESGVNPYNRNAGLLDNWTEYFFLREMRLMKKEGYKPEGFVSIAKLEEALEKGEYKEIPQGIADCFILLDKLKAKDALVPSAVDIALDKAVFAEINAKRKSAAKVIGRYFDLLADLKNVSVAYRARKAEFSLDKAKEMFLPMGTIDKKDLLKIAEFGEDAADKISAGGFVKEALSVLKEGVGAYEVYTDDALIALLKKERYDMFSPAPIAGLYIGKLREIKNVRLLLARIANGVDKELIKGRMRELYV